MFLYHHTTLKLHVFHILSHSFRVCCLRNSRFFFKQLNFCFSENNKSEFVDFWSEICDRDLELHLSSRALAALLSRSWIDIAVSYVQRAWTQLLISTNEKKKEDLQRACVVSGIILFLFETGGPSINEKDKILREFLSKIDLKVFGGLFREWSWNQAFPSHIRDLVHYVKEKDFFVCN